MRAVLAHQNWGVALPQFQLVLGRAGIWCLGFLKGWLSNSQRSQQGPLSSGYNLKQIIFRASLFSEEVIRMQSWFKGDSWGLLPAAGTGLLFL